MMELVKSFGFETQVSKCERGCVCWNVCVVIIEMLPAQ